MGNVCDYLKWRGDLTFHQSPFNEIDNILMCFISYIEFDGIVAPDDEPITLANAMKLYFKKNPRSKVEKENPFLKNPPLIAEEMSRTKRFGSLRLQNYRHKIDYDNFVQFQAIEILMGSKTSYIAFCGTDDTIVGWKEDFYIALGTIPGQVAAKKYLNQISKGNERIFYIGGHSKGGNLAIYASMFCDPEIRPRIRAIFSNDGPGFSKETLRDAGYADLLPRIHKYVPEFSVFGTLFTHIKEPMIIKSNDYGYLQHDLFTWQVEGNHFVRGEKLSPRAEKIHDSVGTWIDDMTLEERDRFINDLFSIMEAPGHTRVSDLLNDSFRSVGKMIKQHKNIAPEMKSKIAYFIRIMLRR